jgi:xanthine/CO dehydrogenase XdhC/CoxF family maturation factor
MITDTTDILRQLARWRQEGKRAALATVLETWGSAPRGPGSHMAINEVGDFVGSVSGGCVEAAVVEEAKGVLADATPRQIEYGVSDADAWAVGLACGGRVRIYVEPVD